ncbi:MAG: hypothetical protein ACK5KN_06530 [Dysgonomonas sp.]|uniref:hypothetical protein n=1 Tax=Dysgonomonas sp. TaxID=1891233 RepID=UPI003A8BF61E
MARRNRQTLKKSFSNGQKPTERDFENLIDSTLNILDDGFSKSPETGIELSPLVGEKRVVMSVFRESGDPKPEWELSVGKSGELKICRYGEDSSAPLIILNTNGGVEIGCKEKDICLNGMVNIPGRKGTFAQGHVPADGKWHDITEELEGVCALEVVAASGRKHTGKHAILVAMATHCFGDKPKIRKIRSHYGVFGNKLNIRWVRNELKSKLQVKSIFYYGDDIQIYYQISSLWDNPLMENI